MGTRRLSRRGSPVAALVNGEELGSKCSWASGRLEWTERPQNVLIIGKRSKEVTVKVLELCEWLVNERDMRVYVEAWRGIAEEWHQRHGHSNETEEHRESRGCSSGSKSAQAHLLSHPPQRLRLSL